MAQSSQQNTNDISELLSLLQNAVVEAFKVQCGMDVRAGKRFLLTEVGFGESIDLAATVGVIGDTASGRSSLCFPSKTFINIVSSWLGESYKEINDDNADAGAELINIIFGILKKKTNDSNRYNFKPALPVVIRGHGINVRPKVGRENPTHAIPFETPHGKCYVTFVLTQSD